MSEESLHTNWTYEIERVDLGHDEAAREELASAIEAEMADEEKEMLRVLAEAEAPPTPSKSFSYKIRKLKRADIYFGGFLDVLSQLSPVEIDTWKAISTWLTRVGTGHHTLVAAKGDKVIGTASYFHEPKYIHRAGRVGRVEEVVVDQEFRGKGVGKALVLACVEELRRLRCYKVILNSSDANVGYYESLGFRRAANTMRMDLIS